MSKKQTQRQWFEKQLKKYKYSTVSNKFKLFKKKFPKSNITSFNESLRRTARELNIYNDSKASLEDNKLKRKILSVYSKTAKNIKDTPSYSDLGFKRNDIVKLFKSKSELDKQARKLYPKRFEEVKNPKVWNRSRFDNLKDTIRNNDTFIITTAIGECDVDYKFLRSIKTYCKENNAKLLILVADQKLDCLDEDLKKEQVVFDDIKLNNNLFISTIKILPKMIEPVTGLDRIGGKRGSFIFGSPKQRLRYIPVSRKDKMPHCIMTTGSITLPKYIGAKYYQKRTDYLAEQDHKMGAVIVNIENQEYYHFRQIQADKSGGFVDLGKYYQGDKSSETETETVVFGDLHTGDTDPNAMKCWEQLCRDIKAKSIVVHDGFNGHSINHHERDDIINRTITYQNNRNGLKKELDEYAQLLNRLTKTHDKIYIVKSNHDDFLYKYLRKGWYIEDPENHLISLDLAKDMILGKNPIQEYVSKKIDHPNKIIWLDRDDDIYIENIKISDHGDKGSNGSRGRSLKSLEKTSHKSIVAHSHSPEILRDFWRVGTSTKLKLSYTEGPSSWFHTSGVIYKGGHRQLINSINGRYLPKK